MSTTIIRLILKAEFVQLGLSFLLVWHLINTEATAQNFWQQTNGPVGIVNTIAINTSGHIFAGTYGGVYRSTNNGDSWTPVNTGLTGSVVFALALNTSEHIFAGTYGGVYRSTNNGDSWTPINTGLVSIGVFALASNTSGHIFAGTDDGIYRSTNNGDNWTLVNTDLMDSEVFALAINTSGHIFAGTDSGGVYRSTNNGDSWTLVNIGLMDSEVLALAINTSGHIFAGTYGGVYRSTNNGDSWTLVNIDLTIFGVFAIAINTSGHIFAGTNGDGVYRSTNNGDNWTRINTGLTGSVVFALAINTSGHIFVGTFDSGIFRSTDNGDTWTPINAGLTNLFVWSLSINSRGRIFAGTVGSGVFFSNQPPSVAHAPLSQQQIGQPISIDAHIIDEDTVDVILNYRKGGYTQFITVPFSSKGDSFAIMIPVDSVTSRGVEYFITATDPFGLTTKEPRSGFFSVQVNVPVGVPKASAQPSGSEQNAYRLISMPLDLGKKTAKEVLEDNLGTYDKKKWRFFALRPDQNYTEISDSLTMDSGKAYLLIVKEPGKIIDTGAGISHRTNQPFAIPLDSAWNFIGNPFNFPIPLNNISLKSGNRFALRYHEGTWRDPILRKRTMMQPFEGYAVFNPSEASDTLLINPDLSSSSSSLAKEFVSVIEEKIVWSIRILAQCQDAVDEDNRAAIVSGASSSWDELDQPEPPVIGEYVSVYFPHPEWGKLAKSYCTDVRPMTSDDRLQTSNGEIWPFEVKTNIRDKVNLTFEGLDKVPPELEVWLVDEALKITQNLREQRQYAVAGAGTVAVAVAEAGAGHPKQLKLVVGRRDFVDEKLAGARAIPTTYELSQNFPNPFNPATTIRYGLPSAERVTLKIYNLLGAEVVTLVGNEQKTAGYHAAIWDGRDKASRAVVSGVYVYRLQAGSFVMTKKLALVK